MKEISGWTINLKEVYGDLWKKRESSHPVEDLWESPNGVVAGLLYDIAEIGVSKEVGRLAVFQNKENPELILNLPKLTCWYLYKSAVQFGSNELLFVHRFESHLMRIGIRLCAIDLRNRSIVSPDQLTENFYSVRQIDGKIYGFTKMNQHDSSEEMTIDLQKLTWKPVG